MSSAIAARKKQNLVLRERVEQVAEELNRYYQAALYTKLYKSVAFKRGVPRLAQLTKTQRDHFRLAARDVIALNATPRQWIAAQFDKFADFSRGRQRPMLPYTGQLFGLGAIARYTEFMQIEQDREARQPKKRDYASPSKFFRYERKLAGLAKVMMRTEAEVLRSHPEEFSPEFLKHRGVWNVVEDAFYEAREG